MENAKPISERVATCKYLRSHEMYFLESDEDETENHSGVYWCGKTQEDFGPDGESAGKDECSGGRDCHKA